MFPEGKINRVLIILNPRSGHRKQASLYKKVISYCANYGIATQEVILDENFSEPEIEKIVSDFRPQVIAAGGGDGTVNFAASLVQRTDMALGILPLGTNNALAKNLHLPQNVPEAMDTIVNGHIKEIDSLQINGKNCYHVCDLGFNANVVKRIHKNTKRNMFQYFWAFLKELSRRRHFRFSVRTPKENISGKAFSITVTNTRIYGTNAAINPKGKLADGMFEICIIKPYPFWMFFKMTWQLFRGTIYKSPYCIILRTDEAVLENVDSESIHIDGEPVILDKTLKIKVLHKSLKVMVPKGIN